MAKKYRGVTYREGKNLYEGRFQYSGTTYSVYGKTAKEAADKLEELKHEVKHGLYCKPQSITVSGWFDTWIENKLAQGEIKRSTAQRYKSANKSFVLPKIGNRKLCDIQAPALRKLIADIKADGKDGSAQITYIMLNGLFQAAAYDNIIQSNPMQNVKPPKKKQTAPEDKRVLSREEQQLFLKYAAKSSYYDFYKVLLMTGCRINELTALEWKNVDFKKQEINITGTLVYIRGEGRFKDTPKSETSRRVVPMLPEVQAILQQQRKEQLENRMALGKDYKQENGLTDVCFQYPTGGAYWSEAIRHDLEKVNADIREDHPEFKPIHPHVLRHTFATRWIENGGSMKTLQTILGHSNYGITADIYSHVLPDTKQEEMRKAMGDMFS